MIMELVAVDYEALMKNGFWQNSEVFRKEYTSNGTDVIIIIPKSEEDNFWCMVKQPQSDYYVDSTLLMPNYILEELTTLLEQGIIKRGKE